MTTETLMTDTSATTTEAATASENAAATAPQGTEAAADQQQAAEGNATDTAKAGEGDGDQGKQDTKADTYGAPEKYEFQQPEGVELNDTALGAFSEFAKDANLSQDAAQALLGKLAPAMAQHQAAVLEQVRTEWATTAKTDTEYGGAKLQENLAVAKRALDTFGTQELRTLLNDSGLGNHPEIIRAFFRAGKAISEDTFVPGGTAPKGEGRRDHAKALYPNQ